MNYFKILRECEEKVFTEEDTNLLATCYRCGHKYKIKEMSEVGLNVFKCANCVKDAK